MRLTAALTLILSEDNDQLHQYLDEDLHLDDVSLTTFKPARLTVAAGAVDQQFVITPEVTTGKYLLVLVRTTRVSVKLNATTAPAIGVKPLPAASANIMSQYQKTEQPGIWFMGPLDTGVAVTTLYFSNPAAVAANVLVAVIGNA